MKERICCTYNSLPFHRLPPQLIINMVYAATFWLNSFPPASGVSPTISPHALVAGTTIDYHWHCQLEFGTYLQTHEAHFNSLQSLTTGALTLRPTGNEEQGGYYFFSLTSGRLLNRNKWIALPMPQEVIDCVHLLAKRSTGPYGLIILDRNMAILPDDPDDPDDHDPLAP
jgi:hypothetical protein